MDTLAAEKPVQQFEERDGVIYFSVTSNGMSGREWIAHFETPERRLQSYVHDVLLSPSFKPTKGVTTMIHAIKGGFWTHEDRTSRNLFKEMRSRGLVKPEAEVACLIRDKFSNEDLEAMGVGYITTMHEGIFDSGNKANVLSAGRTSDRMFFTAAYYYAGDRRWDEAEAFAFAVPQK